jgi:hypothetical protein
MNFVGVLLTFFGVFVGIWAVFKYLILIEMRLDATTYKTLWEMCKSERKFLVREEFVGESKPPVMYAAFCFFKEAPWFYLNHSERLLTAGWQGKDTVTVATCFRWRYKKLKHFLGTRLREMQLLKLGVPVELLTPHYTDRIGALKKVTPRPLLETDAWEDIENEVAQVAAGTRERVGALLYGPPGNGKSYFIKYLATKYQMSIKIITFSPEFTNHDVMMMFSQITPNSIVLFEDFDNYFDGRTCILGSGNNGIKFTFDIILNCLDGAYSTYEKVVFVMTVNEINKVDHALKNRPSRLKYVREFSNPSMAIRQKILPALWVEGTEGLNLDQLMRMKEFHGEGLSLEDSLKKLEKKVKDSDIEKAAHQRYEERVAAGIPGSPEDDWTHAINRLK